MRYFSALIVFLFFFKCSSAQEKPSDLSKYSYNVFGFRKVITTEGRFTSAATGCYLSINSSQYFLTAKHVLTGCDSNKIDKFRPDTFYVIDVSKRAQALGLDVRTWRLPDTCQHSTRDLDIFSSKISEVEQDSSHYIRRLENLDSIGAKDLYMYGYPTKDRTTNEKIMFPKTSLFYRAREKLVIHRNYFLESYPDSVNLWIETEGIEKDMKGFSGSPVFFYDKWTKESFLAGILVANCKDCGQHKDFIVVARIDKILNRINSAKEMVR